MPGDPVDITNAAETNVTYYPEISWLPNLHSNEVSGTNSETYMETLRPDPVATHLGENVSVVQTNFNDSAWRLLNLPHDWVLELPFDSSADRGHGYKSGIYDGSTSTNAVGWYRRTFTLPANYAGQSMWLEFDGVYRNSLVWLNGHILGRNVSGYSSFSYDISQYANPGGTNALVVRVDTRRLEGWFYEGAGIYRHVWLVETSPTHVAHWGTYVRSTVVNTNATISAQTQVNNDNTNSTAACSLISTILDPNSNVVATATQPLSIPAGSNVVVTQTLSLTNVQLWSLQSPALYQLVSTVVQAGATNDVFQTPFGVRTIKFDPNLGLFLNGQHVELQGTCNHQDHAGVGVALPDRLQYFRVERLKEMGCNACRTSHNPPTPEFLNACDQLGMLVLDENRRMGTNAEPLGELQRLVLRDRNHPSVFCFSMCNEENDLEQNNPVGAPIMQTMVNWVHQLDTGSKCTAAMNSWSGGAANGFSTALDVQGYNYMNNGSMDGFHGSNPNMPSLSTEEASTVFTRGIYANTSTYVSAYDLNLPNGFCSTAEAWWQYYAQRPWNEGAFVWTGFDYRGEPSPFNWPNISSEYGILDTCGFPKDVFYYYQANWTLKPVLHLLPHWNWSAGKSLNIWAFGNCQVVELFTNGVSLGRQPLNVQSHVEWDGVAYSPGTLQAIGYNNGVAVITNTIVTTGVPVSVALIPDRSTILADGRDVSVVKVAVLDAAGNIVPTAGNTVNFTVNSGTILGVGNGDPASLQADKPATPVSAARSLFNGLAEVIIQSTNQTGFITLTATASGLVSTNVTIAEVAVLPPPPAPTGVAAVSGNAQVLVSWDIVPGAITYNLWRSPTQGGPYTLIAGNIGGVNLGYADTNVANLTTYYYVVTANGSGTSANSMEANATPAQFVTGLTATAANGQILLNWSPIPGAKYNLKRASVSGGPYTTIATSTSNTNYSDINVASCQEYYYVVTITNAGYESLPSVEAGTEVLEALPSIWSNADIGSVGLAGSANYCNGQFTVNGSGGDIWGTVDAFHFVYVYLPANTNCDLRARVVAVQDTAGNAKAAMEIRQSLAANSAHALVDVEPSSGIELLYRPTAGGSTYSTVVSGEAPPNWVRLTWINNIFTAYWSPDGNTWNQIGLATNLTMSAGVYVGLAVCAHNNGVLNTSMLDNVSVLPPVTGLAASTTNGQLTLNWSGSSGENYNVARATVSGGPYTTIATALSSTNFTDPSAVSCQPYYYLVTATNASVASPPSAELAVEIPGGAPPAPWLNADIGAVGLAGSAGYCNGQFIISGSGGDIWGTADAFQFVYVYLPTGANCDIRARVDSVQNTSGNAKAALMIRQSLAAGAIHATVDVEPSAGIELLWRSANAGTTTSTVIAGQTAPNWVRLTWTNGVFAAYWSPDGTTWNQIGTATGLTMNAGVYVGLAVCAHNNAVLNTSLMDNVAASFLPTNIPPVLAAIPNQVVNVGQTVALTANASDSNYPPQTLTFSLASAPASASLTPVNNTNAIFQWRPAVTNANTVNSIRLIVKDGGSPALSATQSFNVSVNPLIRPTMPNVVWTNGQFTLNVSNSMVGPDYAIQVSSNLMNWDTLFITNQSSTNVFRWTDTNAGTAPVQFYRVKIGPPLT